MAPQAYKFFSTHDREISGWKILSRLLHSRGPHLGGINGDVQSDLATLEFKNGEQLEDFHSRILIIQHEINLSGETVPPTILLYHYIKAFSNSDKLKIFIAPNMKDLITFLDNNGKSAVYKGVNIHTIYFYIEMIGSTTTFTTSFQHSHNFGPLYSINNDTASSQSVIEALHMIQMSICKFCGGIGHKADACIVRGPKFLPPSIRRKINQFNSIHGE